MSEYKVPFTAILNIEDHPNADRLSIATVYGFSVIIPKNRYSVGSLVIYVPIDSIIPQNLEDHLFPPDAKVKLTKHRVRQIRLRKIASQGMLISKKEIKEVYGIDLKEEEKNYAEILGITKYEPPAPKFNGVSGGKKRNKPLENPLFQKYNGLNNIKWFPTMFTEDEIVVCQEKIHGTNSRAGMLPYAANTIWKKIKRFLGLTPKFEFCFGSNNVQLQERPEFTGYYDDNVYGKVFKALDTDKKLKNNEIIYGEIYGSGIQKNYSYGCKEGEHKFVLFDVKILKKDGTQYWLSPDEVTGFAKERGFDMVPEVYRGKFSMEKVKEMTVGNSVLAFSQKIREGVVVKSVYNYCDDRGDKKALKVLSEKYLDKENTDFH